jgi:DNA repair protein RAD5
MVFIIECCTFTQVLYLFILEMGLGKTIEILSLIHANRCRFDNPQQIPKASHMKKCSPTTLIVCPMSLLAQWRDEIIRGSNPDTITVELYYGGDRSNSLSNKLCKWDGSAPDVLITTYGVLMNEWTKKSDVSPSALYKIEFWRIVLDEAHQIKNRLTKTSQACRDIHAKRRWAVTGTPIQNKLDDLYSLVRFLRHEPWANHIFWKTFITVPFEKKDPRALSAVQTVLEPIVLRRTKAMRDRLGQPMVPLPPKTINIEYLAFSREEQDIYDAIYNDSQVKFSYYCEAGQVGRNYASIFQLLTRLRQICCHPYMALQSKDASKEEVSGKGMTLEELIAHKSSQDTSQSVSSEPSSYGLSVLQNMLAKQQASPTEEDTNETSAIPDECPICFESVDAVIVMPCMHMACRPCVMDYFQKKEDEGAAGECPVCRHGPILQNQLLEFAQQQISGPQNKNIRFDIRKAVGGYKPSTKINALVKHLRQNRKEGLKTVVFSQFTSFLDLIGQSLENESIDYTRLDGTQAQAQREKVLATFSKQDGSGASVLLISLRAGGVGLNLTCANRIVMMVCLAAGFMFTYN